VFGGDRPHDADQVRVDAVDVVAVVAVPPRADDDRLVAVGGTERATRVRAAAESTPTRTQAVRVGSSAGTTRSAQGWTSSYSAAALPPRPSRVSALT